MVDTLRGIVRIPHINGVCHYFVLNLYLNVPNLTVRYAPDNIRSTSRTTNPRQHDNTYAVLNTRQHSLLEEEGDSTASEIEDEAVEKPSREKNVNRKNNATFNN